MASVTGVIDGDLDAVLSSAFKEREKMAKKEGGEVLESFLKDKALYDSVCGFPNDPVNSRYRRTTYTTLPYIIRASGMPLKEAFAQLGIQVMWPNDEAEQLYLQLKKMNENHQKKLLEYMKALINPWWAGAIQDDNHITKNPTQRLLVYYSKKYDSHGDVRFRLSKTFGHEFERVYKDKKRMTTISTKGFVELSRKMEISLHWIYGSDKSYTILADSVTQEQIISIYLFMYEPERQIVQNYIKLAEGEGIL